MTLSEAKANRKRYHKHSSYGPLFPEGLYVIKKLPIEFDGIPVIYTSMRSFEESVIFYSGKTPQLPWERFKASPVNVTVYSCCKWLTAMPRSLAMSKIKQSSLSYAQQAMLAYTYASHMSSIMVARNEEVAAERRRSQIKE